MKRLLALLSLLGLGLFWGCHLGAGNEKDTFDVAGDTSWTHCDTILVILLDKDGRPLDTLYKDSLASLDELNKLDATSYPGGEAGVRIAGYYKDGRVCVDQTRTFLEDGTLVKVDTLADPNALPDSVAGDPVHLSLVADGPSGKVKGKVLPAYVDQGLYWSLEPQGVASLDVGPETVAGEVTVSPLALGEAILTLKSRKDGSKQAKVKVRVNAAAASTVSLDNDSLVLFVNGPEGELKAVVTPHLADPAVAWSSADTAVAKVDSTGKVKPGKEGRTWVYALTGNGKKDSASILVIADVPTLQVSSGFGAPVNVEIEFNATAFQKVGNLVRFAWDFKGDGTWDDSLPGPWFGDSVSLPKVSFRYSEEGVYTARFKVADSEGNIGYASVTVDIGNQAPAIIAVRADTSISVKDSIAMTAKVRDLDGKVAWVGWDYEGDGHYDDTLITSDTLVEVVLGHRYEEAGNYLAVFRAVDGNGKARMDTARIKVEFDLPVADLGEDTTVIVNSTFILKLKGEDGYGKIVKRELRTGTGAFVTVSKGDTAIKAPAAPTEIIYMLRVTDDDGLQGTDTLKVAVILCANADLSGLAISAGALVPAFLPGTANYAAQVAFADSLVRVTPTALDTSVDITVNGTANPSGAASAPVKLSVGSNNNAFTIKLVSDDGSQRTYTVSVTRQPNAEATLKTLVATGFTLKPAFAANVLDYLDTVPQAVAAITLRPTVASIGATVAVNGQAVASGTPTPNLALQPGDNNFQVVVTAMDTAVKTTYRIKVVRLTKLYIYRKLGAAAAVLADSAQIPLGVSRPISSPGATGHAFTRWSIQEGTAAFADSGSNPTTITMGSGLVRAQAAFTLNRYTITGTSSGCGDIDPAPGTATYDYGATVNYTLTPRTDCRLVSVKVDGVDEPSAMDGTYSFTNLSGNRTLAAVFVRTYSLSGQAGPGGSINPSAAIRVDSGSTRTVTITPNSDQKIISLKDNGVAAAAPFPTSYILTNISGNHHVEVAFSAGFTLNATVALGLGTITPPSVGVDYGAAQTFTFKPASGYRYLSLADNGSPASGVVGDSQYTLTNVTAAHNLQVRFMRRVSITVTPVGCGTVSPGSQPAVDSGTSHTFAFSPLSGCKVDSLIVNGAPITPAGSHAFNPVTQNSTLRVVFVRTFTIATTWGTSGNNQVGGSVTPANPGVDSLDAQNFTIAVNAGYRRSGLTVNGNAITPVPSVYNFPSVTANQALHASFVRTFLQTASVGLGMGSITPASITVDTMASQSFSFSAANANYRFHSFLLNGNPISPSGGTNHTLTGINRENALQVRFWRLYTVTTTASGCGTVSAGGIVDSASTPSYTFGMGTGCTMDSLFVDGNPVTVASSYTFAPITGNRTLRAVFSQGYTVTTLWGTSGNNHVGGSISPANPGVVSGQSVTLGINVLPGYRRLSFSVGGVPVTPVPSSHTISSVTANTTAQAVFLRTFNLTSQVGLGLGTITPASVTVDTNGSQAFTFAPANANYRFHSLLLNGQSVTPNGNGQHTVSPVYRDTALVARFWRLYTITTTAVGCGTATAGGLRDSASNNSFTFSPSTGCKVDSLYVDGSIQSPAGSWAFNNLTAGHTLRVVFVRTFTVATSVSTTGTLGVGGSISPANPLVDSLDPVTLAINPAAGYRRLSLVVNGNTVSPAASYTFSSITSAGQTLHADFWRTFRATGTAATSGGTVSPGGADVDSATGSVVFSITPQPGYRIDTVWDGPTIRLTGGTETRTYTMSGLSGPRELRATFRRLWDLKVEVTGEGKASPEGGVMDEGSDQPVDFEAGQGYTLVQLLDNGKDVTQQLAGDPSGRSRYVITKVSEQHTLQAAFSRQEGYRLRIVDSVVLGRSEREPETLPRVCARWESQGGSGQQCSDEKSGILDVTLPAGTKVDIEAERTVTVCNALACTEKPFTFWYRRRGQEEQTDETNPASFGLSESMDIRAVYGGSSPK